MTAAAWLRLMVFATVATAAVVGCRSSKEQKASGTEQPPQAPANAGPAQVRPAAELPAAISTDVLITAVEVLSYRTPGDTAAERRSFAEHVVFLSAQRAALIARTGDLYVHDKYIAPEGALSRPNMYTDYMEFQSAYQHSLAGEFAVDGAQIDLLVKFLDRTELARALEIRAEELAAQLAKAADTGDAGVGARRVAFLTEETELNQRCRRALGAVNNRVSPKFEIVELPLGSHGEIASRLGKLSRCVALVDGKLATEMATEGQWEEALGQPVRPLSGYPAMIDAHMHVLPGGFARAKEIMDTTSAQSAVVMTLQRDVTGTTLAEDNGALLTGAATNAKMVPLVFLDPSMPDLVAVLDAAIADGARGVKLISGHGEFWDKTGRRPLNRPELDAVFARCGEKKLPVFWHVNVHLLDDGALAAIAKHANTVFVLPHLAGYLTFAPQILGGLLETYPNVYVDLSFGSQFWYMDRSLRDLGLYAAQWKELIQKYATRFLFAADLVVTETSSLAHARSQVELHLDMLTKDSYVADLVPVRGIGRLGDSGHHPGTLRGLGLDARTLQQILRKNAMSLGLVR